MHGWTDPLDPDRHYRHGDRPRYSPSDEPRYPDEADGRHPYDASPYDASDRHPGEADGRDPYRHSSDWAEPALYQLSDRDGYDTGYPYPAGERPAYGAFQPSYRGPAGSDGSAYPPVDEPAFRSGSEFFSGHGQASTSEFFSGQGRVSTPAEGRVERRRLPRPAVMAAAAAAATLAVMIGIGALLLPSGSDGDATRPASEAGAAAPATSPGAGSGGPLIASGPATPTPGASRPAPRATSSAHSAPKAAPRPRQTSGGGKAAAGPAGGNSAPTAGLSSREQQVVGLVNKERASAGCGALTVNSLLMKAARLHTQDQASHNNMSHTGSDGSSLGQRIDRVGYQWRTIGENVAFGQRTPAEVMDAWMNSPGHRANILNCQFKEIGVGVVPDDDGRLYWTQDFGA